MIRMINSVYRWFFKDGICCEECVEANSTEPKKENCEIYKDSPRFSVEVLDALRKDVGKFPAERGGLLGSTSDHKLIDLYCFDVKSKNTAASYDYNVEYMSMKFKEWKKKGYIAHSFIHSHPYSLNTPSYPDIVSAYIHMKFFNHDYFYIPIVHSERRGFYTLYFYVARLVGNVVKVRSEYIIQATSCGYEYVPFKEWSVESSVEEILEYRKRNRAVPDKSKRNNKHTNKQSVQHQQRKPAEKGQVYTVQFIENCAAVDGEIYKLYIVSDVDSQGKSVMKGYALDDDQYLNYLYGKHLDEKNLKLSCVFSPIRRKESVYEQKNF